jgi:putative transposase
VRRRTKVIGRFPGESSCLSLCWALLDLVISHSNNVTFTDLEQLLLARIARERPTRTTTKEVIAA